MGKPSRIDKEALRILTQVMQRSAASSTAQITVESGAAPVLGGKEAQLMLSAFTLELDKLDEFSRQAVGAKLMGFFDAVTSLQPGEIAEPIPGIKISKDPDSLVILARGRQADP